jgi:hypothetical protein
MVQEMETEEGDAHMHESAKNNIVRVHSPNKHKRVETV